MSQAATLIHDNYDEPALVHVVDPALQRDRVLQQQTSDNGGTAGSQDLYEWASKTFHRAKIAVVDLITTYPLTTAFSTVLSSMFVIGWVALWWALSLPLKLFLLTMFTGFAGFAGLFLVNSYGYLKHHGLVSLLPESVQNFLFHRSIMEVVLDSWLKNFIQDLLMVVMAHDEAELLDAIERLPVSLQTIFKQRGFLHLTPAYARDLVVPKGQAWPAERRMPLDDDDFGGRELHAGAGTGRHRFSSSHDMQALSSAFQDGTYFISEHKHGEDVEFRSPFNSHAVHRRSSRTIRRISSNNLSSLAALGGAGDILAEGIPSSFDHAIPHSLSHQSLASLSGAAAPMTPTPLFAHAPAPAFSSGAAMPHLSLPPATIAEAAAPRRGSSRVGAHDAHVDGPAAAVVATRTPAARRHASSPYHEDENTESAVSGASSPAAALRRSPASHSSSRSVSPDLQFQQQPPQPAAAASAASPVAPRANPSKSHRSGRRKTKASGGLAQLLDKRIRAKIEAAVQKTFVEPIARIPDSRLQFLAGTSGLIAVAMFSRSKSVRRATTKGALVGAYALMVATSLTAAAILHRRSVASRRIAHRVSRTAAYTAATVENARPTNESVAKVAFVGVVAGALYYAYKDDPPRLSTIRELLKF